MHAAAINQGLTFYSFDEETETFNTVTFTSATGLMASLAAQVPYLLWGASQNVSNLPTPSKETTLGIVIPTEEVSGINNLNVIEDELTDI